MVPESSMTQVKPLSFPDAMTEAARAWKGSALTSRQRTRTHAKNLFFIGYLHLLFFNYIVLFSPIKVNRYPSIRTAKNPLPFPAVGSGAVWF
jgi:hypothetical protein